MSLWGTHAKSHPPDDSPDLSYVMSVITAVGGLSAYQTRASAAGLVAGVGLGAVFALGGYWIQTKNYERHEMAHQMSLLASVMFAGAMGFRAGSNPYVGPGGNMLAALGGTSSAYHLKKMLDWRQWNQQRVLEAERLLAKYQAQDGKRAQQVELAGAERPPAQQQLGLPRAAGPLARPPSDRPPVPPGGY